MSWMRFFRRRRHDEEFEREVASYIAIETDDNLARGMSPDDAHRAAVRKFGNATLVREDIHTMNTIGFIDNFWQDLKLAGRLLRRDKGFAIAATLSLALGIGANSAIFQLLDVVRLRALPVQEPDRLAEVYFPDGSARSGSFSSRFPYMTTAQFEQLRRHQTIFTGLFAWSSRGLNTASGGEIRSVEALWVTGDAFTVLGVRPAIGRLIDAEDDRKGCAPVAVISHAYWQRAFGGAPSVLDSTVRLEGVTFDIIGVTAPEFFGLDVGRRFDVAVPVCADSFLSAANRLESAREWWLSAIGRLPAGVTIQQATDHLIAISPAITKTTVPTGVTSEGEQKYLANKLNAFPVASGVSDVRESFGEPLVVLLAATGLILLVACANLANLLLARAGARSKEIAVRLAIGASRARIVRQLLVESALLVVIGTSVGMLVARGLTGVLVTQLEDSMGTLFLDLSWNVKMFGFTAGVAAATCLLFGLAPALKATALAPADAMKAGGRGITDGRDRFGLRRGLVVAQVGLSLVLLIGALLFTRTLYNLVTIDAGFDQHVVVAGLGHKSLMEGEPDERQLLRERLREAIASHPAVADVAASRNQPLTGRWWNEFVQVDSSSEKVVANFNRVSGNYFQMLGIPLVKGRTFTAQDVRQSPPVAVVNETFVRKMFPDGSALGRTLWIETAPDQPIERIEIVGVSADTKYNNIRRDFEPLVHLGEAQDTDARDSAWFVVKPRGSIDALMPAIERSVATVNPAISLDLSVISRKVRGALVRERMMAALSAAFGALAGLLAAVGLYGVMSYTVTRRSNEFGIRLAMGARRFEVLRLVMTEAGVLMIVGLAIGAALGLSAATAARSLLFGLQPTDPATITSAIVLLAVIGVVAAYLPARRASNLDPVTVLRAE